MFGLGSKDEDAVEKMMKHPRSTRRPSDVAAQLTPPVVVATLPLREAAALAALQGLLAFDGYTSAEKLVSRSRLLADLLVAELAANNVDVNDA